MRSTSLSVNQVFDGTIYLLFPALDFLIECDVDSETVRALYNQGGSETDESTDLFFVDVEAITGDKLEESFVSRFTPHCAGSIHLLIHRLDQEASANLT